MDSNDFKSAHIDRFLWSLEEFDINKHQRRNMIVITYYHYYYFDSPFDALFVRCVHFHWWRDIQYLWDENTNATIKNNPHDVYSSFVVVVFIFDLYRKPY